jgi:hypothetical protein
MGMGKKRNAYSVSFGKSQQERLLKDACVDGRIAMSGCVYWIQIAGFCEHYNEWPFEFHERDNFRIKTLHHGITFY